MTKNKQAKQKKTSRIGNKIRTAALGLTLMIAPAMGCTGSETTAVPAMKPVAAKKVEVKKAVKKQAEKSKKKAKCDIVMTSEEVNEISSMLIKKCKNGESETLMMDQTITTKSGKQAKVLRIDKGGALLAFGERDEKNGNGKYLVATYVPFTKSGTTFTIMDPALLEGKEKEKMASIHDDLMVVVCPSKDQPAAKLGMSTMKVVKKTWGQLKCLIAGLRKEPEEKIEAQKKLMKIKEEQKKLRKQEKELRKQLRKKAPRKEIPLNIPKRRTGT